MPDRSSIKSQCMYSSKTFAPSMMTVYIDHAILNVTGRDHQRTASIYGRIFPGSEKELNAVEEKKEDENVTGVLV